VERSEWTLSFREWCLECVEGLGDILFDSVGLVEGVLLAISGLVGGVLFNVTGLVGGGVQPAFCAFRFWRRLGDRTILL
jgi:hypothetical protein